MDLQAAGGVEQDVAGVEADGGEQREVGEEDDGRFGNACDQSGGRFEHFQLEESGVEIEKAGEDQGREAQPRGPEFKYQPHAERAENKAIDGDPGECAAGGERDGDDLFAGNERQGEAERVVEAGGGVEAEPNERCGGPEPDAIAAAIVIDAMRADAEHDDGERRGCREHG